MMERWALVALTACGRSGFEAGSSDAGSSDYRSRVLEDSPIGYWRFDEAVTPVAHDASGHGKDGTYQAVTLGETGALSAADTAVALAGNSDSLVEFGQDFGFEGQAPFTIELWANPALPAATLLGKVDFSAA